MIELGGKLINPTMVAAVEPASGRAATQWTNVLMDNGIWVNVEERYDNVKAALL